MANYRPRRYRKKRAPAKKKGLKNLENKIKTIALRQCETKLKSSTEENNQLNHNRTFFLSNFLYTNQAVNAPEGFDNATGSRLGDEIVGRGIKFKFWLSNKSDRPNVMYNIYVFRYNTLENTTESVFWRGTNGQGGTMNRMLDQPNGSRIKVLKKIPVYSQSQYVGVETTDNASFDKEHSYFRECWIPLNNKKIHYRRDESGVPKTWDIGVAIVAYDAFGTLSTDTIASFGYSHTLYFKDP